MSGGLDEAGATDVSWGGVLAARGFTVVVGRGAAVLTPASFEVEGPFGTHAVALPTSATQIAKRHAPRAETQQVESFALDDPDDGNVLILGTASILAHLHSRSRERQRSLGKLFSSKASPLSTHAIMHVNDPCASRTSWHPAPMDDDNKKPGEYFREGLTLMFKAARGAAKQVESTLLDKNLDRALAELGRAVTTVGRAVSEEINRVASSPPPWAKPKRDDVSSGIRVEDPSQTPQNAPSGDPVPGGSAQPTDPSRDPSCPPDRPRAE